jgi:hypothetical protein
MSLLLMLLWISLCLTLPTSLLLINSLSVSSSSTARSWAQSSSPVETHILKRYWWFQPGSMYTCTHTQRLTHPIQPIFVEFHSCNVMCYLGIQDRDFAPCSRTIDSPGLNIFCMLIIMMIIMISIFEKTKFDRYPESKSFKWGTPKRNAKADP